MPLAQGSYLADVLDFCARVVVTTDAPASSVRELSAVSGRPMIIRKMTTSRPQQRDDHRLRGLVQRTGDLTIATDLGIPRSTARGWRGAAGRGQSGASESHRARAPAGDPEAAATRPEARRAPPVGARLVTNVRVQTLRRAPAGRTSQATNPSRRGSGTRAYPDASGPPVPADVAESVSGLAPTTDCVCARRSVVLPSDVTASTDALGGSGDRGHGHLA